MIRMMLLFVLLAPTVARAQSSDEFFDSRTLHDIRLYVNSRDLAELRTRYLEDVYVPGDFEWRGIRVRNVGVRVRGLATRSAIKPGLRIDFNRYTAEQAFLGMSALVLDNALKDPSLMRERISMAFIKRMGQPAPRESFARVYINGSYEGLYALVEAGGQRVPCAGAWRRTRLSVRTQVHRRFLRRVPRRRLRAVQNALRGQNPRARG
jgi:spore coat protein CotH